MDGREVVLDGDYAYIAGGVGTNALGIVDISNPLDPEFVSVTTGQTESGHGLRKQGDYVFLGGRSSKSVEVYDVSDPTTPSPVSFVSDEDFGGLQRMLIVDDTLYAGVAGSLDPAVDEGDPGLAIFDIENPEDISAVGLLESGVESIYRPIQEPGTDRVWCSSYRDGFLQTFDISDRQNPTLTGSFDIPGYNVGRDILLKDEFVFINDRLDGRVFSVDISNPSDPQVVGTAQSARFEGARDMTFTQSENNIVLSARDVDRVGVVNIESLSNPSVFTNYTQEDFKGPYGIAYRNGFVMTSHAGPGDAGQFVVIQPEDEL